MPNGKSPGNDGLTKEVFETFWSEVKKKRFSSCILHYFGKEELFAKSIKKKDKDKRLIQN